MEFEQRGEVVACGAEGLDSPYALGQLDGFFVVLARAIAPPPFPHQEGLSLRNVPQGAGFVVPGRGGFQCPSRSGQSSLGAADVHAMQRGFGFGESLVDGIFFTRGSPNFAHEPKAAAMDGLDPLLFGAGVAQRSAGGHDAAAERRFGDERVAPDGLEQFVLGHHAAGMGHQVGDDAKHLRLHLDQTAASTQLARRQINFEVAESVDHPVSL